MAMEQGLGTIERAFQLAPLCTSVDEIRKRLKSEGHSSVEAHLAGAKIRADLTKELKKTGS